MRLLNATRRRAFTLVELLAVLAIISVLAGILYPVFASVKQAAVRTHCLTNFGKAGKGTTLYSVDYDDRLMPTNHRPGMPSDAVLDRTWPQLLMPYVRDFRTFSCPTKPTTMDFGGSFDPELLPGDYAARYYEASLHSDLGYNAYYLSPTIWNGFEWSARPRSSTEVPPDILLFIESGDNKTGAYVVSPPCRYAEESNHWVDTFAADSAQPSGRPVDGDFVYAPVRGWTLSNGDGKMPYGGVWRRHGDRLNVVRLDGSARSMTLEQVSEGCDVRPTWGGTITNVHQYAWYPR